MACGIIIDSRQQRGKHDHKHDYFESMGVGTVVCALPFGDYALVPPVSVDTKKDIYELAMDIDRDHDRFRNEMVKARDLGCHLYILVENEDGVTDIQSLSEWVEPPRHFEMRRRRSGNPKTRRIEGIRLAKACMTMERKYKATFLFCRPDEAGRIVDELLKGGE